MSQEVAVIEVGKSDDNANKNEEGARLIGENTESSSAVLEQEASQVLPKGGSFVSLTRVKFLCAHLDLVCSKNVRV